MSMDDLIFVGLNRYVAALDRRTGEIVWTYKDMHYGYVTLLLDGDRLIVSSSGYLYCLDPLTGKLRWHNPMKGFGTDAPTALVSVRGQSSQAQAEQFAAAQAAAAVIATS